MNGKTYVNFLTPVSGGTETSSSYLLNLTHYTCGNKEMCVNNSNGFPDASVTSVQVVGAPTPIPNSSVYCCNIRCICELIYEQVYGCGCKDNCLQSEKVVAVVCVPVTSSDIPTVSDVGVSVSPIDVNCGCDLTNQVNMSVAFTLSTTTANNENNG